MKILLKLHEKKTLTFKFGGRFQNFNKNYFLNNKTAWNYYFVEVEDNKIKFVNKRKIQI